MICFVKTKAEQAAPFFRRGLNRKTGISFFTSFRKRGVKLKKSSRTFLPFFLPSGAVKRGLKLLSHLKARDMKKQILFLFNLLKLKFPQPAVFLMRSRLCGLPRGDFFCLLRRAALISALSGGLLFAVSGCTAEGLELISQLEATALKKAVIDDKKFCKQNVGLNHKRKQDLCNDFFASLRITSHCVTMRKTELVEQEYCERFLYRMLIRPTRFFGQDDHKQDSLKGADDAIAWDWFDREAMDDFLHSNPNERDGKPATNDERELILKRIAESPDLARAPASRIGRIIMIKGEGTI